MHSLLSRPVLDPVITLNDINFPGYLLPKTLTYFSDLLVLTFISIVMSQPHPLFDNVRVSRSHSILVLQFQPHFYCDVTDPTTHLID